LQKKGFYPLYSGKTELSLSVPMFANIQVFCLFACERVWSFSLFLQVSRENGNVIQIVRHGSGEKISKLLVDGVSSDTSLMQIDAFLNAKKIEFYASE
jgi:hypothetical protein